MVSLSFYHFINIVDSHGEFLQCLRASSCLALHHLERTSAVMLRGLLGLNSSVHCFTARLTADSQAADGDA